MTHRRFRTLTSSLLAACWLLLLLPRPAAASTPTVAFGPDQGIAEGDSGSTTMSFSLTLSGAQSGTTVTVSYATTAITATSGSGCTGGTDFQATGSTVQLTAATPSHTVAVPICGDTLDEENAETFFVAITGLSGNAQITRATANGTIGDDDPLPTISIIGGDGNTLERDSGQREAWTLHVSLDKASGRTVKVDYTTADETAIGGTACGGEVDYLTASGTLTFEPGQQQKDVAITYCGDTRDEPDEEALLRLSNPVNAELSQSHPQATVEIRTDEPKLSLSDATVQEGNTGTRDAVFTISVSAPTTRPIEVSAVLFAPPSNTATGAAACGGDADFVNARQTLTINPGQVSKTFGVPICGDIRDEADETFEVTLSLPTGAGLDRSRGTATIKDDDAPPTLSISDVTAAEGGLAQFQVTLSRASGQEVKFRASTANGTATGGDCAGGAAFVSLQDREFSIPPAATSVTVDVQTCTDSADERAETFFVNLSGPQNATILDGQGKGTITDDDLPNLSISDASATEGSSVRFVFSLSNPAIDPVTVDYRTEPISNGATGGVCGAAGVDYAEKTGRLTIPAGQSSAIVDVATCNDTLDEGPEFFFLSVSNITNAVTSCECGTPSGGVLDNDGPKVSVDSPTESAAEGGGPLVFTIRLSATTPEDVTITFKTLDGPVAAGVGAAVGKPLCSDPGADYQAVTSGSVQIPHDQTSATTAVMVCDDGDVEGLEQLTLQLTGATGAALDPQKKQATGRISSADQPALSIVGSGQDGKTTVAEPTGASGSATAAFTVKLSGKPVQPVTVHYATAPSGDHPAKEGTATSCPTGNPGPDPVDYLHKEGTLTFAANTTLLSQTVQVPVCGDATDERPETFVIALSAPTNAPIADGLGAATGIINDNDGPKISIEGLGGPVAEGAGRATFTVKLDGPNIEPIPFTLKTVDGPTATGVGAATGKSSCDAAGADYRAIAADEVQVFGPSAGPTQMEILADICNDGVIEGDEQFTVQLVGAHGATIDSQRNRATARIASDDLPVASIVDTLSVAEPDGTAASRTANVAVTLSARPPAGSRATVSYEVGGLGDLLDSRARGAAACPSANGGADPVDFVSRTGSLDFLSSDPVDGQGRVTKQIQVTVCGDTLDEPREPLPVGLTSATGATIDQSKRKATLTIADNDGPKISIEAVTASVQEGAAGATATANLKVKLSAASPDPVTVSYKTQNGTAAAPGDYVAVPATTLTFQPDEVEKQVQVTINGDATREGNETFTVVLSGPTGATLDPQRTRATVTVTNDD